MESSGGVGGHVLISFISIFFVFELLTGACHLEGLNGTFYFFLNKKKKNDIFGSLFFDEKSIFYF